MTAVRTSLARRVTSAAAAGIMAGGMALGVAMPAAFAPAAAAAEKSSPGTFAGDFELPQRWNDDFKPGTHCATPGQNGTWITAKRRWFKQTDAASVTNRNDESVPVTHKVTDKRTQTLEVSGKVKGEGDLAKLMTNTFGFTYVHEAHWSLQQVVGPYELPANEQGKLVWGFTMLDTDNQDVKCGEDQVWHEQGKPYSASVPEGRYSELRLDDAPDYDSR